MPVSLKKFAIGAAGAALLATTATAQPAAAATDNQMAFYTGPYLTGTKTIVDLDTSGQCEKLAQGAKTAQNLSSLEVEVYFTADCRIGPPGTPAGLHHVVGGLEYAIFRVDAVSYRVRG
jgi:hypothetical protein